MSTLRGPWDRRQVSNYLSESLIPLRLAANMADGFPVVVSLWFLWDGTDLWCAMHESARLVAHLRRDERVAFEVAGDQPPYRGVRGQARAAISAARDGHGLLTELLTRYLGGADGDLARWLLSREGELAIRVSPVNMSSWDYTARMSR